MPHRFNHWPYPVAAAWKDAEREKADHDPLTRYDALEAVWQRVLRLMSLSTLGAVTPSSPGLPLPPLESLRRPSLGDWRSVLDSCLKRPSGKGQQFEHLRSLSSIYRKGRKRTGSRDFIHQIMGKRRFSRKVGLSAVFEALIAARNERGHTDRVATEKRRWAAAVVPSLEACVEELLDDRDLAERLKIYHIADGAPVAVDGATPLAERAGHEWTQGIIACGEEACVSLDGLALTSDCPRCGQLSLLLVSAFGYARHDDRAPRSRYACLACGEAVSRARWSELLFRRVRGTSDLPWAEGPSTRLTAAIGQPVSVVFDVFNPCLKPIHQVDIEFNEQSSDVDMVAYDAISEIAGRSRGRLKRQLLVRDQAQLTIRPSLMWRQGKRSRQPLTRALSPVEIHVENPHARASMIGRAAEWEALQKRFLDARDTHGSLVIIEGDDGCGRSLLASRFRDAHTEHAATLSTRCYPEKLRPLRPLVEIVLKYARYYAGIERWRGSEDSEESDVMLFAGDVEAAVNRLAEYEDFDLPEISVSDDTQRALRYLQHLFDLIGRSGQPIILIVEDLDRADPAVLEILQSLGNEAHRRKLLLIATVSTTRPRREENTRSLVDLRSIAGLQLTLSPFDPPALREYLQARYGNHGLPEALVERLLVETEGVPLFVARALDSLEASGVLLKQRGTWGATGDVDTVDISHQIDESIRRRLKALPDDYRAVLRRAAVVGQRFPFPLLEAIEAWRQGTTRLSEQERYRLLEVLGELERSFRVLRSAGGQKEFAHRRLYNTAYHELTEDERRELHGLVVRYLQQEPPTPDQDKLIAEHAFGAGMTDLALTSTLEFAQACEADDRLNDATEILVRAEGAIDTSAETATHGAVVGLRRLASKALHMKGRITASMEIGEETLREAIRGGDQREIIESLLDKAAGLRDRNEYREAEECLAEADQRALRSDEPLLLAKIRARAAELQHRLGQSDDAREFAERALASCGDGEEYHEVRADSLLTLARAVNELGQTAIAVDHARQAKNLYERCGVEGKIARADYALSWFHAARGDLEQAQRAAERALASRMRRGEFLEAAKVRGRFGSLLVRAGQLPRAREAIQAARHFFEREQNEERMAECDLQLAELEFEQDHTKEALRLASRALLCFQSRGYREGVAKATIWQLKAMAQNGSPEEIEALLAEATALVDHHTLEPGTDIEYQMVRVHAGCRAGLASGDITHRDRLLRQALAVLADLRDRRLDAMTTRQTADWHMERATALRHLGQQEEARRDAERTVELSRSLGDTMLTLKAKTFWASVMVDLGRFEVDTELEQLVEACEEHDDPKGKAYCYRALMRIAMGRGEPDRARKFKSLANSIHQEIDDYRGVGLNEDLLPRGLVTPAGG